MGFNIENIILIIIIGLCIFVFLYIKEKYNKQIREVSKYLNATTKKKFIFNQIIEDQFNNIPYVIKYLLNRYSSAFQIEFHVKPPFKLSIRKENIDTRISKKIGLVKEIKINVPDFDNKYLILSDDKMLSEQYLYNPRIREIIEYIDSKGWNMRFKKTHVYLEKEIKHNEQLVISGAEVKEILENVYEISQKW